MTAFHRDRVEQHQGSTKINHVNDPLAVIYNENQWRIYKVSPLYDFQYNAVKLKQYAAKIRQTLVSSVTNKVSLKYSVQFEIQSHLKYSEDDCDGLSISVSSTQENTNSTKLSYHCLLLSWGMSNKLKDGVHLPYLLERGEQKVGNSVKATLQTIFDCNINQITLTQNQLLHFGFTLVETDTSRSTDPFVLTYTTPQADLKDKLNLTFDVGDIGIIWNGIKDESTKKSELLTLGYQILQNQIFHMMMLDISMLDLYVVTLPKVEVKYNGTFKMKTPEAVNAVLTVLNELNINSLKVDKTC